MKIFSLAVMLLVLCAFVFPIRDSQQKSTKNRGGVANVVFKSTDGGQTWQDISKGLPENLQQDAFRGNRFFVNDKGLFVKVGKELYHNTPNATVAFWKKEIFAGEPGSIAPAKSGTLPNNYWSVNLIKANGTSVWSPMFDYSVEPRIRSVFETAGGTIFVGTDKGIFKTTNIGKTWKQVYAGGFVGNMAELDGVLMATGMKRIIRSTDNGENWAPVTSEGVVAWDVKQINGGFAAMSSISEPGKRTLSTSYDNGKTWQPIDGSLQSDSIWQTWNDRPRVQRYGASITQVGENFFCTHPQGIFRSTDKGKTWIFLLPSIKDKFFNLFISGNVIYAIAGKGGC